MVNGNRTMNDNQLKWILYALEGTGIAFVGLFLASYLGGLFMVPQTTVLHSIPEIKMALSVLGGILLVLIFIAVIFKVKKSSNNEPTTPKQQRLVTPLTVGLLMVAIAYFLFTLHATFTLSWIGEWEPLAEPLRSWILVTDVVAGVFLIFRFIAGTLAIATASLYFAKKGLTQSTLYKLIRAILVFEGLYWIGLLPSGVWGFVPNAGGLNGLNVNLLISTGIPCIISSIGIPIVLFLTAIKLKPNQSLAKPMKWGLAAGVLYVLTLWLNNTGMWIISILQKGSSVALGTPEAILSFGSTVLGLLALVISTAYFAKKSLNNQTINLPIAGAIITALGAYFLWNYLTWIYFGGWNQWYAWFLGHNLDLYLLVLPLLGVPLLFYKKSFGSEKFAE